MPSVPTKKHDWEQFCDPCKSASNIGPLSPYWLQTQAIPAYSTADLAKVCSLIKKLCENAQVTNSKGNFEEDTQGWKI